MPLIMREYFLILLRFDEVTENDFQFLCFLLNIKKNKETILC